MNRINNRQIDKQSGAVLIVSLLMLLVTTMLGITSMSTAVMEEKMASNSRQKQLAFQAAESGLRFAETWLTNNVTNIVTFTNNFNSGSALVELYWDKQPNNATVVSPLGFDVYDETAWTIGTSIATGQVLVGTQPSPRYIIEYMGKDGIAPVNEDEQDSRRHAFRITSIGTGTNQITTHIGQSTFRMPLI